MERIFHPGFPTVALSESLTMGFITAFADMETPPPLTQVINTGAVCEEGKGTGTETRFQGGQQRGVGKLLGPPPLPTPPSTTC